MSMSGHLNAMGIIAKNEFNSIIDNPLVIVVGLILLLLAFTNGYGGREMLAPLSYLKNGQDSFMQGILQVFYYTIFICNIMAAFLGVVSVAKERWAYSINVLLTKPLYKLDVLLGKFIGIGAFLFIFISAVLVFTTVILIIFFEEPLSYAELCTRLFAYIIIFAGECSLVAALSMLAGTIVNNLIGSVAIVITYIFVEWFWYAGNHIGNFSFITPRMLLLDMSSPVQGYPELFNTLVPLTKWLNDAAPYIIFLILYITVILIIDCLAFVKMDT